MQITIKDKHEDGKLLAVLDTPLTEVARSKIRASEGPFHIMINNQGGAHNAFSALNFLKSLNESGIQAKVIYKTHKQDCHSIFKQDENKLNNIFVKCIIA